jgi:hypothetical protein
MLARYLGQPCTRKEGRSGRVAPSKPWVASAHSIASATARQRAAETNWLGRAKRATVAAQLTGFPGLASMRDGIAAGPVFRAC